MRSPAPTLREGLFYIVLAILALMVISERPGERLPSEVVLVGSLP